MKTLSIGITIQDLAIIIVKSMDTFLRTTLEHILEEIIVDGWVKQHAFVVTKLVMWERTTQQGSRYLNLKDTTKIVKSMDIENLNADPSLHGHQTR